MKKYCNSISILSVIEIACQKSTLWLFGEAQTCKTLSRGLGTRGWELKEREVGVL